MKSTKKVTAELISAGYMREGDMQAGEIILAKYHAAAADAQETKKFAAEDKAYQARVIADAEELAAADLDMGQIEDRFVQAEVINSANALIDKDETMFEQADAMIVAACTEAAVALAAAKLVDNENLEAVTRLIAMLWNTNEENEE